MTFDASTRFFPGDLEQLRCFYYAALYRSFTRCAEHLLASQPTVSKHIKALEGVVGAPLFLRSRRGATLTEAGQSLFELVEPIVTAVDALPSQMHERISNHEPEEVRLAAGQELLLHLVAPVLRPFRQRYPDVRVIVTSRVRQQTYEMVANDAVDFGITPAAEIPPSLIFEPVLNDELVLIVAPGHELAHKASIGLTDVAAYPILLPDAASSTRRVIEGLFQSQRLGVRVSMELERWHVIREFVALGQGIAIVPRFTTSGDEQRVVIRSLTPSLPGLAYGFVSRRGRRLSAAGRHLMTAIGERHAATRARLDTAASG